MKGSIFTASLVASFVGALALTITALLLHLSIDYYLATIGTVVTSLAFAFGTYFVVIAIDAYAQLQSVRASAESAQKLAGSLQLREAQVKELQISFDFLQRSVSGVGEKLHQSAERILQLFVEYVLSLPAQNRKNDPVRERLLKQAHCIRNRFLIESQYTEPEAKRMAVLSLLQYKDLEAVPLIQRVYESAEDPLLKEACKMALDKMH